MRFYVNQFAAIESGGGRRAINRSAAVFLVSYARDNRRMPIALSGSKAEFIQMSRTAGKRWDSRDTEKLLSRGAQTGSRSRHRREQWQFVLY